PACETYVHILNVAQDRGSIGTRQRGVQGVGASTAIQYVDVFERVGGSTRVVLDNRSSEDVVAGGAREAVFTDGQDEVLATNIVGFAISYFFGISNSVFVGSNTNEDISAGLG